MRRLFALLGEELKNGGDAVLVSIIASSGSTPHCAFLMRSSPALLPR